MNLPHIDEKIEKLVNVYETRNPFRLAKELNVVIAFEDLGEIYGYYNQFKRVKMIHINVNSSDMQQRNTCAHELGHSILHPEENTPMLSKQSIVSELKIEKEANYFAVNLTIDNKHNDLVNMRSFQKLEAFGFPEEFERFLN